MRMVNTIDGRAITAVAIGQAAGNAPDGCDTDTRKIMNFAVGEILFKVFNDLPSIYKRLELGWSAKILKEISAFFDAPETDDGLKKGVFGACLLAFGVVSIRFHGRISVLTR